MLKKLPNTYLIGLLAILLIAYLGVVFWDTSGRSTSVREVLVEIDTAQATKLIMEKAGQEAVFIKKQDGWYGQKEGGQEIPLVDATVQATLGQLLEVKPSRLVAKSKAKWKEFQVDSAGLRVQLYEKDNKTLDLVVGRIGSKGDQRRGNLSLYTYVRLWEDDEVYAADNFMGISLKPDIDQYRNKQVLGFIADSLSSIKFTYPADSSFTLEQQDGSWTVAGQPADSAMVANYLSEVGQASNRNFVDNLALENLEHALYEVEFLQKDGSNAIVRGFKNPQYEWLLHSSMNPDNLFAAPTLAETLFRGSDYFMGK